MAFEAPVVDELSVRGVVDSRYERFLPKRSHPLVRIEHMGRVPGRPDMTYACEWGLSLHLASIKDGAKWPTTITAKPSARASSCATITPTSTPRATS